MRRMLTMLTVAALAATACGDGGAHDAGPVPSRPAPSTTAAPTATTGPSQGTTPGTAGGSSATTDGATTNVSVWLVRGETLETVTRAVPKVPRVGAEAVKALLAGPTAAEANRGLATAIPRETRFGGLEIVDGVARVDLSRDFEAGGGSLGVTLRLAQVTCTVGQFPTVKGVRFLVAGQLVSVFSGDGIVVDKPVTCDSYRQFQGQAAASATFAGIWPFATKAELDAYAGGGDRLFRDPVATAREFAARYVGMEEPVTFAFRASGAGAGEVPVGFRFREGRNPLPDPQPTFTVSVRQLGAQGADGPWTVVGAASANLRVDGPKAGDRVTSPLAVSGNVVAFEATAQLQVREDGMLAGQSLGRGVMTGGAGSVPFRAPGRPAGALVVLDLGAADGQVLRATVVRVRFTA
jgi:hypothetical protein